MVSIEIKKTKMPNGKNYYQVYYNGKTNYDFFQIGKRGNPDKINFSTKKEALEIEKLFNSKSKKIFKIRI